jgi:hypothetical protein
MAKCQEQSLRQGPSHIAIAVMLWEMSSLVERMESTVGGSNSVASSVSVEGL